jgi:hypothetical protein
VVPSANGTKLRVVLTEDSGKTWTAPMDTVESGAGVDFKQWMAYGPTGVLSLFWKKQRDDLPPPPEYKVQRAENWVDVPQYGFDVYNVISCDGGHHWEKPVRVNAVTSPAGPSARHDDLSYLAADAAASHLVWGDRRIQPQVHNVPGAIGGTHAFYARVPFSVFTRERSCGR